MLLAELSPKPQSKPLKACCIVFPQGLTHYVYYSKMWDLESPPYM